MLVYLSSSSKKSPIAHFKGHLGYMERQYHRYTPIKITVSLLWPFLRFTGLSFKSSTGIFHASKLYPFTEKLEKMVLSRKKTEVWKTIPEQNSRSK
ncbi:hypothetical protein Y1Q_0003204 [Alligator mississippiensis]|uniref:Uncharacterized protein n=1 Tax=Alligator mississippiensis TaxID=8496 RepID=A0A151MDU8_ALLMI|nr:hypothetical protein Y1Q_0003204 [Alligator mississippiensis]